MNGREIETMTVLKQNGGSLVDQKMPAKGKPNLSSYSGRTAALIRSTREEKGMSVKQVAEHCTANGYKLATSTLWKWENGNGTVNMDAMPFLAKALKVRITDLFPAK